LNLDGCDLNSIDFKYLLGRPRFCSKVPIQLSNKLDGMKLIKL